MDNMFSNYRISDKNSTIHQMLKAFTIASMSWRQVFSDSVTAETEDDWWITEGIVGLFADYRGKFIEKFDPFHRYVFMSVFELMYETLGNDQSPPLVAPWSNEKRDSFSIKCRALFIMQMVSVLIGEESYQNLLKDIYQKFQDKSISTNDYLELLKNHEPDDIDMGNFLRPWLELPLFPMVKVKVDRREGLLHYSQDLFKVNPTDEDYKEQLGIEEFVWPLPIKIQFGNNSGPYSDTFLSIENRKNGTVNFKRKLADDEWLIVNPNADFLYLVNYDEAYWNCTGDQLAKNHSVFSRLTRTKLIFDRAYDLYAKKIANDSTYEEDVEIFNHQFRYINKEKNVFVRRMLNRIEKLGEEWNITDYAIEWEPFNEESFD